MQVGHCLFKVVQERLYVSRLEFLNCNLLFKFTFLAAEEEEYVSAREYLSKGLPQFLQEGVDPAEGVE